MEYNKVLLAGKMVSKAEMMQMGSVQGAKFDLEYTNYKKQTSKFTIYVTNEKTVGFLNKPYMRIGTEVFVEGMLTATEGKPISIFASNINICKFAPPPEKEKEAQKRNEVTITPDDFDGDDIPF